MDLDEEGDMPAHGVGREVKVLAMAEMLSDEELLQEIKDEAVHMCLVCSPLEEEGNRPRCLRSATTGATPKEAERMEKKRSMRH